MHPLQNVRRSEEDTIFQELKKYEEYLDIPENIEEFLPAFKSALFFKDWTDEVPEDKLFERYGMAPGIMYVKLTNADWLLYSSFELAKLLKLKNVKKNVSDLRTRVKYGVREELLGLVKIKWIGRVRARKLWSAGIKTALGMKQQKAKLKSLLGTAVADKIIQELSSEGA